MPETEEEEQEEEGVVEEEEEPPIVSVHTLTVRVAFMKYQRNHCT